MVETHKTDLEEDLDKLVLEFQAMVEAILPEHQEQSRETMQKVLLRDYNHILDFEQVKKRIDIDGLTGLLKYDAFVRDLYAEVAAARASGEYLSLMFMDGDRFKQYNDEFSHEVGNVVVKAFGTLLTDMLQDYGRLYRYGGDEFVTIIRGKTPEEVTAKAGYICGQVGKGIHYYLDAILMSDPNYKVTADRLKSQEIDAMRMYDALLSLVSKMRVSCGVYTAQIREVLSDADYAQTFIETADGYLKEAKNLGRNRVVSSLGVVELD